MDVVVLGDTHLRAGVERLPQVLLDALARCDAIVHTGDVVSATALSELRRLGTVHAVLGNNDHELRGLLPEQLCLELGSVGVAIVHDSGPARGREARMARRFPDAQLVLFGHSHIPVNDAGLGGQILFNPGSPTQRRAQPYPSFGRLRLAAGRILERRIETIQATASLSPAAR